MRPFADTFRNRLCSRRNAERIAHRIAEEGISARVIRTGSTLQPYRVDTGNKATPPGEDVEVQVVIL